MKTFKGWKLKGHTLSAPNGKATYDVRYVPDVKGERASAKIGGKVRRIYRIIWSVIHGVDLPPWVEIHHVNHNHVDCRPDNLIALNKGDHIAAHRLIIDMIAAFIDGDINKALQLRTAYLKFIRACKVTPEMIEE